MKRRTQKDRELAERSRFARAWRNWHREQLEEALAGTHHDVMARLMRELKDLRSARALVAFISSMDWSAVDYGTRLIALHEVNAAITALRERNGLDPIDDPLPGQPDNAFLVIRGSLFP